jgi:hypothetical protein
VFEIKVNNLNNNLKFSMILLYEEGERVRSQKQNSLYNLSKYSGLSTPKLRAKGLSRLRRPSFFAFAVLATLSLVHA